MLSSVFVCMSLSEQALAPRSATIGPIPCAISPAASSYAALGAAAATQKEAQRTFQRGAPTMLRSDSRSAAPAYALNRACQRFRDVCQENATDIKPNRCFLLFGPLRKMRRPSTLMSFWDPNYLSIHAPNPNEPTHRTIFHLLNYTKPGTARTADISAHRFGVSASAPRKPHWVLLRSRTDEELVERKNLARWSPLIITEAGS